MNYNYGFFLNRDMGADQTGWDASHAQLLTNSWQQTFGTPYSLLARKSNFTLSNGSNTTLLDMTGVKAVVAPCFVRLQIFNVTTRTSGTQELFVDVQKGATSTKIMNKIDLTSENKFTPDDMENFYMSVHSRNDNISLATTSGLELIENVGSWPMTPPDWGTRSSTTKVQSAYRVRS